MAFDREHRYDSQIDGDSELLELAEKHRFVVVIGDQSAVRFKNIVGRWPNIMIVDGKCEDENATSLMTDFLKDLEPVYNDVFEISYQLNEAVYDLVTNRKDGVIRVIGEEDPAECLVKLYAPNDVLIIWGDRANKKLMCAIGGKEARSAGIYALTRGGPPDDDKY